MSRSPTSRGSGSGLGRSPGCPRPAPPLPPRPLQRSSPPVAALGQRPARARPRGRRGPGSLRARPRAPPSARRRPPPARGPAEAQRSEPGVAHPARREGRGACPGPRSLPRDSASVRTGLSVVVPTESPLCAGHTGGKAPGPRQCPACRRQAVGRWGRELVAQRVFSATCLGCALQEGLLTEESLDPDLGRGARL